MDDLVVFGVGELGKLFAASALSAGLRVTPITRAHRPSERLRNVPAGTPILLAVGEDALPAALDALPAAALRDTILLQNELWPSVWEARGFTPTVFLPWVLQKPGMARIVVGTSSCFGPFSDLCMRLCETLAMPAERVPDMPALQQALAEKYAFILTINALGVWRDDALGALLADSLERVQALCAEAAQLSGASMGTGIDALRCLQRTTHAMQAMASIRARGRTARARVQRALARADALGLNLPTLRACMGQPNG